jgi:DNA-binding CsgD family transcriptional regulator
LNAPAYYFAAGVFMSEKKVIELTEDPDITRRSLNKSTNLVTRILILLGNRAPSLKQRQLVETLLFNISFRAELLFDRRLSPREQECLLLAAVGFSATETAEILSIGQKTVEECRNNTRKKLHCKNMIQAVVQGIRYGHVSEKIPLKSRKNWGEYSGLSE